jgi:hypothetical protein
MFDELVCVLLLLLCFSSSLRVVSIDFRSAGKLPQLQDNCPQLNLLLRLL